jgi:outer membrane lipoprotein-sorting protein
MKLSRRSRWGVPATVAVVAGAVIAGTQITTAQAAPGLPAKTPAQLLADVGANNESAPMTGTVVETTSLGLPALPQTGGPASLASLLTGSHTVKVYYSSSRHFRLAVPQSLSETDIIRNGEVAWLWDSTRNAVTKYTLPAETAKHAQPEPSTGAVLTPGQAADEVLKSVGKTTTVSTQSNVLVAGVAAYQLVLAPKDSRSLIGRVTIAVDGANGVPLRLQVFAKGSSASAGSVPAFQVGYTQVSFTAPAAANLEFTPPPGATVTQENLAAHGGAATGSADAGSGTYGSDWLTVAALPQSDLSLNGTAGGSSPAPPAGSGAIGGSSQQVLNALIGAAQPVSGSWGSGTLLHTSLLNVLMTGGEVYIGAVEPSVLYAAVGHTTSGHTGG